jgi:hypothetical protein
VESAHLPSVIVIDPVDSRKLQSRSQVESARRWYAGREVEHGFEHGGASLQSEAPVLRQAQRVDQVSAHGYQPTIEGRRKTRRIANQQRRGESSRTAAAVNGVPQYRAYAFPPEHSDRFN